MSKILKIVGADKATTMNLKRRVKIRTERWQALVVRNLIRNLAARTNDVDKSIKKKEHLPDHSQSISAHASEALGGTASQSRYRQTSGLMSVTCVPFFNKPSQALHSVLAEFLQCKLQDSGHKDYPCLQRWWSVSFSITLASVTNLKINNRSTIEVYSLFT